MPSRISTRSLSPLLFALTCAVAPAVPAQQGKLTDVSVQGYIYEPQKLAPTQARIASLQVPAGFALNRFAEGLDNPRMLAVAGNGDVYVTQRIPGNVVLLRDTDRDGVADVQRIVVRLKDAHGIAIRGRQIYLTDVKKVYEAPLLEDGSVGRLRTIARGLPDGGQHPNRTLGFSPSGDLFVSVGSTCNECREPNPENATLLKLSDESRKGRAIYASGLRNTIGFGWQPVSGKLFGFDHGIDWLGNDEQSEELNELVEGHRYGWPFVYDNDQINPHSEPVKLTSEQWAKLSDEPVGMYTAHAAPMQMTFYTGTALPGAANDAFIAMRGSWNRKPPSGYEVVRIRFDQAGAFAGLEPFVTGFMVPTPEGAHGYFGRPVGIAQAGDGSLLFGDDTNNTMYRVSAATAPAPAIEPQTLASEIFSAAPRTLKVTSTAFTDGGNIPKRYSDYGAGISPPLQIDNVPAGTRSLVLMMEDPAALAPLPFVHWTGINIAADRRVVPENVPTIYEPLRGDPARQGSTSKSTTGYFGPRPPVGDPPHRYFFQVFALDTTLDLPAGFNRHALLKAMQGHVTAQGVTVGLFAAPDVTAAKANE